MSAEAVLLRAIEDIEPGSYVSADTIREPLTAAGLSSAEKSGAFRHACSTGYLIAVTVTIQGRAYPVTVPTEHESGKGRAVRLYRRTMKRLPEGRAAA